MSITESHGSNKKRKLVPDDVYNTFERQDCTIQDNTSKEDRPVKRTNSILDSVEQ
ncbi:hypothetical protein RhiirA5_426296 [Rhizophagus irregularis]|uniref:Uncharacterized protein n=1 Tax=Rhizophagus irregularis TaxID=588596 RepID=A0A2N0P4D1_9GLOM|nr:hypothetical protein RhiirA5_426296 [Rhizophagus irregularis]GBC17265.2 hypothetical protein RIR_e17301_A0A2N0P4D1_9GLOM [Rhizophagus irregularis DAOM 181602=DAOM 197198]